MILEEKEGLEGMKLRDLKKRIRRKKGGYKSNSSLGKIHINLLNVNWILIIFRNSAEVRGRFSAWRLPSGGVGVYVRKAQVKNQ